MGSNEFSSRLFTLTIDLRDPKEAAIVIITVLLFTRRVALAIGLKNQRRRTPHGK
jgi:hypothetical protein